MKKVLNAEVMLVTNLGSQQSKVWNHCSKNNSCAKIGKIFGELEADEHDAC